MKKKIIRLTGILLTLVVLLTSGSITALADEVGASDDKDIESVNEEHGMGYRAPIDEIIPESVSVKSSARKRILRSTPESIPAKYPSDPINQSEFDAYMPPLRDQGDFGSCWAHSAMALAEIGLRKNGIITNNDLDLSELHLAYFSYNFVVDPLEGTAGDGNYGDFIGKNNYLAGGGNLEYASRVLAMWTGAADEAIATYPSGAENLPKSLDAGIAYDDLAHIVGYNAVSINASDADREAVKRLVWQNGGVGISYCASEGTYDSCYNIEHNAFYDPVKKDSTHAVTIVGWDDNFPKDNFNTGNQPVNDGAWLIRNSWMTGNHKDNKSFCYNGYFWMSYETATIDDVAYSFIFDTASNYDNNYQYDGAMLSREIDETGAIEAANVFVSNGSEELEAVSFETPSSNVTYTVSVYKDLTEEKFDPTELAAVSTASGTITTPGYYTIPLNDKVYLDKDNRFAVVVKLEKGEKDKVCINKEFADGSKDWFHTKTSALKGQSYIKRGNVWLDFGDIYNQNIRIKAFTNDVEIPPTPTPTPLSATVSQKGTLTYNGSEQQAEVEKTCTTPDVSEVKWFYTTTPEDEGSYSSEIPKFKDAGTYRVYYKATADGYKDATGDFAVTIDKAPLEVNWSSESSWKYDGAEHEVTATLEGIVNSDDVSPLVEGNKQINAGEYTAYVMGLDGESKDNYVLPDTGLSKDYSITKRQVTISSGSANKEEYDGSALTNDNIDISGDEFVEGEGVNCTITGSRTAPGSSDNTFTYTYKPGTNAGNYDITTEFGTLSVGWWKDKEKHIHTVTAKSGTVTYNGSQQSVSGFTDDSLSFTEADETYIISGLSAEAVGTTVEVYPNLVEGTPAVHDSRGNDVTDYFVIEPVNGKLEIKARNLSDAGITLSNELVYNGSEQTQNFSVTVDGRSLTKGTDYDVTGEKATNVGEHTLTITGKGNYEGTATKKYTIADPKLTGVSVSADGSLKYNGYMQEPQVITKADQSDVRFMYATSRDGTFTSDVPRFKNAGEYTVYYRAEKPGYETATGSFKVTIDKAKVGIRWENTSFTYDGYSHVPIARATGALGNDSVLFEVSGSASDPGTHTAEVTGIKGINAANYELPSDRTRSFTITRANNPSGGNSSSGSNSSGSKSSASTSSGSSAGSKSSASTSSGSSSGGKSSTSKSSDSSSGSKSSTSTGSGSATGSKSNASTKSSNSAGSRSSASTGSNSSSGAGSTAKTDETDSNSSGNNSNNKTITDDSAREIEEGAKLADNEATLKAVFGEEKFKELEEEGKAPSVRLETKVMRPVPQKEKDLVKAGIGVYASSLPNLVAGEYLDINLEVNEDGDWTSVKNVKEPVQIVIRLTKKLMAKADVFYVLRLHEGEATLLYDVDDDPETVTINTDGFSTYVLLYQDNKADSESETGRREIASPESGEDGGYAASQIEGAPNTGTNATVNTPATSSDSELWRVWVFAALLVLIGVLVFICVKGPSLRNKREQE